MKLSIIIPTVGRATLKTVVEILLSNKLFVHKDIEIIVVYDGIKPTLKIDKPGLIQLQAPKKSYAGGARNFGLDKAQGEVIAFLGDDTIPDENWLEHTLTWHKSHPDRAEALLGRVAWVDRLAGDRFHQWMDQYAQFDYARLDRGFPPGWHHFYTSNVSVKRALIQDERFHEAFRGWGFEDAEFGYRLAKKGMQLHYQAGVRVYHDDPQTLETLMERTTAAHKNALVFELLHPEVKILPRHFKRGLLQLIVWGLWPLSFVPEVHWWRIWKQRWLG